MKKCTKCFIEKPLTGFYYDNHKKDKRHPECKSCFNQRMKETRKMTAYKKRSNTTVAFALTNNMRLYATVASERATKGQGGNEYLHTRYTDETGDEFLTVKIDRGEVVHDEDGTLHRYEVTVKNRNIVLVNRRKHWIREKGERQKGETWDGKRLDACECGSRVVHTHE